MVFQKLKCHLCNSHSVTMVPDRQPDVPNSHDVHDGRSSVQHSEHQMRVAMPTDHAVMQCCDSSDTFCQLLKPTNFGYRNNVQPEVGRARRAERRRCTTCPASRRYLLAGSAALLALLDGATLPSPAHAAVGAPCRSSKTNYELIKCLRARRKETEEVCTTLLQCAPHQSRAASKSSGSSFT